jgi:N,N-dimethylformamidase
VSVRIIGYSDPLTARPGDVVRFMVSCDAPEYRAELVRLIHGDLDSRGPGFKFETCDVDLPGGGRHPGRKQIIRPGSYVEVPGDRFTDLMSFTLRTNVYATKPSDGAQALLTCWDDERQAGYGMFLGDDGALEFWAGDGVLPVERVSTGRALLGDRWYSLTCRYHPSDGTVELGQLPLRAFPSDPSRIAATGKVKVAASAPPGTAFVMAGVDPRANPANRFRFNGKLEEPAVLTTRADVADRRARKEIVASWDLGSDHSGVSVLDRGPNHLHGSTVNAPLRAVTGSNWTGHEPNFAHAPDQYRAIAFHDDDLDDARWSPDFELRVPKNLRSGFYAVHIVAGGDEDWVTFLVAPEKGHASSKIALLAPTVSYLAYANEHMVADEVRSARSGVPYTEYLASATDYERGLFQYILDNDLHSTYDAHADRTGVHYSSSRRPLANVRPCYHKPSVHFQIPHQLAADLYLIDWFEEKGIDYDVINDHILHDEGVDLLSRYRVVLTGTHPEYYTERMLIAVEEYLNGGGRLMYLGGNGFYWVTSIDPLRPFMIEVRRGEAGTRTWNAYPGENYHSTTSELGGIWRSRGRPPQSLVAIGFTAQGAGEGRPYERLPASFDAANAFIFDGVDDDVIGDFGLYLEAAGGWELDRRDDRLGSPPGTVVLASAMGFSDSYQHVIEEVLDGTNAEEGGTHRPEVRADLAYCEYPNGGAVFSTGSITWAGSLSHNGYDNNISRITENVVRAFASTAELGAVASVREGEEQARD